MESLNQKCSRFYIVLLQIYFMKVQYVILTACIDTCNMAIRSHHYYSTTPAMVMVMVGRATACGPIGVHIPVVAQVHHCACQHMGTGTISMFA